ncbi:MFS transporter [Gordonia sp. CPCC 206044]|uniref:MFS transporter n=1 Tax=Gordonia sp. CPCC 206044 TaxID=3140793 RepID=UPI003AF3B4A9
MTDTLDRLSGQRERVIRARCGRAATTGFALLVVGSNIPAPILPIYRDELQLSTFTVTALFAVYLFALVGTFTTVATSSLTRWAPRVLPVSLGVGMLGDLAFLAGHAQVVWLFVGRVLTGIAVGLGTGAAATIAVATRGDRGRAIAATATLAGSFLGLVGASAVVQLLPGPTITIYVIHLCLLATTMGIVVLALGSARAVLHAELRRTTTDSTVDVVAPAIRESGRSGRGPAWRLRWAGYGLGIAGWAIGGIVVGVLPTLVADEWDSPSVMMTMLAPIVVLGVACLSPYVFRTMHPGLAVAVIGSAAVLCVVGVWLANLPTILACCAIWGVGQGFAYATGLRIVTAGLSPVDQGRVASRYASICYGFTGLLSLCTGAAATAWGPLPSMFLMAGVFVTLSVSVSVLGHRRWP